MNGHSRPHPAIEHPLAVIEADLRRLVTHYTGNFPSDLEPGASRRVHEAIRRHAGLLMRRWPNQSPFVDPDDVVQEWFFLWIKYGVHRYQGYKPLFPVAATILRRLCLSVKRKQRTICPIATEPQQENSCPVCETHSRNLEDALQVAIANLPERYRLALTLRYYECLSSEEAAKKLKVSTGRFHGLTHAARQMLLAELSDSGITSADL